MNKFWNAIILPIIKVINAKYIIEIGSEKGLNTINILEYCMDNDARMSAIDPFPQFDIEEFKAKYGEKFEIYIELSLNQLPLLDNYDVILIDGDHNWYTVYHELKIIEKSFKDKKFPVVFLHDVCWPYARRDLYHNPENIPEAYRHPYKQLGLYPGQSSLLKKGGLNIGLNNSIYENNPKNGVLTAVEDFIIESDLELSLKIINGFNGLGVLYPKNGEIGNIVDNIIENSHLLSDLEEDRIKLKIDRNLLNLQNILSQRTLNEKKTRLKKTEKDFRQTEKQLEDTITQLQQSNQQILEKQAQLEKTEKQFDELNVKVNSLIARFSVLEYQKNRSLMQRFISKFPNLFIIFNRKNGGIRNAFINMKGYNAIKKNNLFNTAYYLKNNFDVKSSGMDPILHYIYHGSRENRKPNPNFDAKYYLETYDDVEKSHLNPLIHYALYGIKENRKTTPLLEETYEEVHSYEGSVIKRYSNDRVNAILKALNHDKKVSIIIPLNKDYENIENCILNIVENTRIPYEIILIHDNSTDERIETLLTKLENIPCVRIIRNKENKGFTDNINTGIWNSEGDVVLLNSNILVTPKWLQKLVVAAYSHEETGIVIPKIVPEASTSSEMSSINQNFSMFIKRKTINDVGFFSNEKYVKNDFCQRAGNKGWNYIIDESNLLYCKGSAPSSSKKDSSIQQQVIPNKHPPYIKEVKKPNNLYNLSNSSDRGDENKKRILYVIHESSVGGTFHTNNDLMMHIQEYFDCYVLQSTGEEIIVGQYVNGKFNKIYSRTTKSKWSVKNIYNPEFRSIYFDVLYGLEIDMVHIRHMIKHTFDLPDVAASLGLPIILSFHDFYLACPSYNLLDDKNEYCAGQCTDGQGRCGTSMKAYDTSDLPLLKLFIKEWRHEVSNIFSKVSAFVTTSQIVKELFISLYPQLSNAEFCVIEHGRDFKEVEEYSKFYELPSEDEPIKILIPGNLNTQKGEDFIKKLKEEDKENKLEFHFIGSLHDDLKDYGIYHGPYERDDFCEYVEMIKPSFIGIFSIWPETYCHTLSEAWSCRIPVLATKIGVLEERVKNTNGGWLLDYKNPSNAYDKIIRIANSRKEYLETVEEVEKIKFKTTKEMAENYLELYQLSYYKPYIFKEDL